MEIVYTEVEKFEQILSILASRFRSTKDEAERRRIEAEYAKIVDRMIATGQWEEGLPAEDELPDESMPPSYFKYWGVTD